MRSGLGQRGDQRGCMQVLDVCRDANPRLVIKRARFSALVRRELERSVAQLAEPDGHAAAAVDARQEIDLRIGASFTRFQTLLLQVRYVFCTRYQPLCRRCLSASLKDAAPSGTQGIRGVAADSAGRAISHAQVSPCKTRLL